MKSKTTESWRKALAVLFAALLIVSTFSAISATISAAGTDLPEEFDNPVIRTDADGNIFFSADPSVRVFDGVMYMYCSHDIFPAQRCDKMDKYHVFSSTNGQDWTDEGEILSAADVGWGEPSGFMWAPDCEKIGDKYYFFYPHKHTDGDWQTGVAVSDTPTGPFTDLGPIEGTKGPGMIDPNILVDGDKAYLYWGGSQKLYAAELTVSDTSVTLGTIKDMTGYCDKFHEGSWVFKRDGKYYMTYASSDDDGGHILAYSVGDSPLGEYEYKGTLLSANAVYMDTSHGSVVEYDGKWLLFYHNMALSGFECLRSVCVDYVTFAADGSINTVTPSPNTAPPVNKTEPTNATVYPINETDWTVGADASVPQDSLPFFNTNNPDNIFVQNMHVTGAYYQTKIIDGGANGGKAKLHFRYSSYNEYSAICVNINGTDYDPAPAAPNGEWEDFTNYTSTTVMLEPGMNTLTITGGYGGVNVSAVYVEMLGEGDIPQDTTSDGSDIPQDTTSDGTPQGTTSNDVPQATIGGGSSQGTDINGVPQGTDVINGIVQPTVNGNQTVIGGGQAGGSVTNTSTSNPKTGVKDAGISVAVAAFSALGLVFVSKKRSK